MVKLQLYVRGFGQTSSDVLGHPPSGRLKFELLELVFQHHLAIFQFLQCSSLGKWFESPHMEFCGFLEFLVLDWAQVVHYYPYYKGREPYNPS